MGLRERGYTLVTHTVILRGEGTQVAERLWLLRHHEQSLLVETQPEGMVAAVVGYMHFLRGGVGPSIVKEEGSDVARLVVVGHKSLIIRGDEQSSIGTAGKVAHQNVAVGRRTQAFKLFALVVPAIQAGCLTSEVEVAVGTQSHDVVGGWLFLGVDAFHFTWWVEAVHLFVVSAQPDAALPVLQHLSGEGEAVGTEIAAQPGRAVGVHVSGAGDAATQPDVAVAELTDVGDVAHGASGVAEGRHGRKVVCLRPIYLQSGARSYQ